MRAATNMAKARTRIVKWCVPSHLANKSLNLIVPNDGRRIAVNKQLATVNCALNGHPERDFQVHYRNILRLRKNKLASSPREVAMCGPQRASPDEET